MNKLDQIMWMAVILVVAGAFLVCLSIFGLTVKAGLVAIGVCMFSYPFLVALIHTAFKFDEETELNKRRFGF